MQASGQTQTLGGLQPPFVPVPRSRRRRRSRRHGGAWKVAFADFVTAMMALFMVLWLWSAGEETQHAVSAYFQDPEGFREVIQERRLALDNRQDALSIEQLTALAESIRQSIRQMPELASLSDFVELAVVDEGLRIELLENDEGTFFRSGDATPSRQGAETLRLIGEQVGKLPNHLVIEGHTDSRPYRGRPDYSNWELSTDRANAARRILVLVGVDPQNIRQVRGFADVELRREDAPEDPSNRRVSLIVLNVSSSS